MCGAAERRPIAAATARHCGFAAASAARQPAYALRFIWTRRPETRIVYEAARDIAADVWIANDWPTLPIAARLARERGGLFVYDLHQLAVEEFAENRRWRFWHRPLARAIEGSLIRRAAGVSVVSDGIADRLQGLYGLSERPRVIRNTPAYRKTRFRPTGSAIAVLYHGIVVPGRGLEACIDSVMLLRPEFTFTIRGSGSRSYLEALQTRIRRSGVGRQGGAGAAGPGHGSCRSGGIVRCRFFALPGHSLHNAFALPNKFFEYVMAGLALCVSDLPEMTRLVRHHDLGRTIPAVSADFIATAINAFDAASIDRCKRNSLAAAQRLCWERESRYRRDRGLVAAPR